MARTKPKRCRHPADFRVGCMIVVEHNVVGLLEHTAWCSACGAFRCKTDKGWRWVSPGVRLTPKRKGRQMRMVEGPKR